VRYLERQVEEERDARRRADTLLARLMDRMPELEAPTDAPAAPEGDNAMPEGDNAMVHSLAMRIAGGESSDQHHLTERQIEWLNMLIPSTIILLVTVVTTAGGFVTSIVSAINGDQVVTMVSAIIGLIGTLGAALVTVLLTRRGRSR
jgi:hypothetical protein